MSGLPIGHARVPTDQQVLTVGSGETNVEVDDPSARSGLDWLAVTAGHYGVGCDAGGDGLHGPSQRSTSWLFGRLE